MEEWLGNNINISGWCSSFNLKVHLTHKWAHIAYTTNLEMCPHQSLVVSEGGQTWKQGFALCFTDHTDTFSLKESRVPSIL